VDAVDKTFFDRDPHDVAVDLLGRRLVDTSSDPQLIGTIIETEVYGGTRDPASHADKGEPTDRTRPMFGSPGTAYVYTIYGIYQCFNIVTPAGKRPSAILIRALHPRQGISEMAERRDIDLKDQNQPSKRRLKNLLSGPGKICQAFDIDETLNGNDLTTPPLFVDKNRKDPKSIQTSPRIGLNPETVGEAAQREWRYTMEDHSSYLSR
jgi:DNA-3-methyladenine glycosylase